MTPAPSHPAVRLAVAAHDSQAHDLEAAPAAAFDAGLRWLDCVIEREVLRLRGRYELSLDEFRGLYVSDRRVDELLSERLGIGAPGDPAAELSQRARELHADFATASPLASVGARVGLADDELDLLLLALAPELDLRYEALYAYLNNDVARRHVSVDLACRLLADSRSRGGITGTLVRARLAPRARLLALAVLEPVEPRLAGSSLHQGFTIAPVIAQSLLGLPIADPRWPQDVGWMAAPGTAARGCNDVAVRVGVIVVTGDASADVRGRALQLAQLRGWPLLGVAPAALARDASLAGRARLAARLAGGAIAIEAFTDDGIAPAMRMARECARESLPVFVLASGEPSIADALADVPHARVAIDVPQAPERATLWRRALAQSGLAVDPLFVERLAEGFMLAPSHVDAIVQSVAWHAGEGADVNAALEREASARSNEGLARLATRIVRPHHWRHLVLPANALQHLRDIAAAIRNRDRVYRRWGLIERTGRSAGLMIFFTGIPGTGKTMAASVIANDVGLDLYRIDLASVVSKYIGETEKNLERIFAVARRSSAILLFDEADALLGKRSEIKDAHDRYANIEVAYLLQKMEEHDGVVILASNLPKNLDPAFARRMHYMLEFARPNASLRERLWRGMFPAAAPLAGDTDFRFLAERFETTGGEIQAVALEAAFLAAAAGEPISMTHLMRAMTRRQTKQGNPGSFDRYREHRAAQSGNVAPDADG